MEMLQSQQRTYPRSKKILLRTTEALASGLTDGFQHNSAVDHAMLQSGMSGLCRVIS
jgi:hypothetical protein